MEVTPEQLKVGLKAMEDSLAPAWFRDSRALDRSWNPYEVPQVVSVSLVRRVFRYLMKR
jgi:hypothetical protein